MVYCGTMGPVLCMHSCSSFFSSKPLTFGIHKTSQHTVGFALIYFEYILNNHSLALFIDKNMTLTHFMFINESGAGE